MRTLPPLLSRSFLWMACALLASSTASAQVKLPGVPSNPVRTRDMLSLARDSGASATVGSQVLFAGGGSSVTGAASDIVDIYDADTKRWSTGALSKPRVVHAGTSVGPLALFAGGVVDATNTPVDIVDIYDSRTGLWTQSNLSVARLALAAASHGTLAFFAGGSATPMLDGSDVVDIYDTQTGIWSVPTQLSVGRTGLAGASAGQKVLFAGGMDFSIGVYDTVDIYDVSTKMWSQEMLSIPRVFLTATAVGSQIFFAGGYDQNFVASNVVDIYDTDTGLWSTTQLSIARGWLAATTVGNKAIFAGGTDDIFAGPNGLYYDRVDIYNASTGAWSQDTLSVGRAYLSAATLRGRAMVAGGWRTPNESLSVIDIFDYSLGSSYCGPAVPNSTGAAAKMLVTGSPTAADNDVVLTASQLPPNEPGFFLTSKKQGFLPNPGGSQGNLCLGGAIGRYTRPGEVSSSGVGGTISLWLDLANTPQPAGPTSVMAGETWNFTAWFRDKNPMSTSNFTDAVSVTFQ